MYWYNRSDVLSNTIYKYAKASNALGKLSRGLSGGHVVPTNSKQNGEDSAYQPLAQSCRQYWIFRHAKRKGQAARQDHEQCHRTKLFGDITQCVETMLHLSNLVAYFWQVSIIRHANDSKAETGDRLENCHCKPSLFSDGYLNYLDDREHHRKKVSRRIFYTTWSLGSLQLLAWKKHREDRTPSEHWRWDLLGLVQKPYRCTHRPPSHSPRPPRPVLPMPHWPGLIKK